MKTNSKRKLSKSLIYVLMVTFVSMNLVAIFHSYKFTHFVEGDKVARTNAPSKLNFVQKVTTILFGVNNPKPHSNLKLPDNYFAKKLKSNVELEIWENDIPRSKGAVLLFHGYSADKSSLLKNAEFFNELGYSTILTDLMGCGNSEGLQTTIGYLEADNVKTVYEYAKKKYPNIILYGNSMGAASLMRAISIYKIDPSKLIIECPFGSMEQTVENRFENMNVPTFPMSYLLTFWGGTINGFWAFGHNPTDYSKDIIQPVLVMYGAEDKNVKRVEVDAIYKSLASGNKSLKIFPKAGHENYLTNFPDEWNGTIATFMNVSK